MCNGDRIRVASERLFFSSIIELMTYWIIELLNYWDFYGGVLWTKWVVPVRQWIVPVRQWIVLTLFLWSMVTNRYDPLPCRYDPLPYRHNNPFCAQSPTIDFNRINSSSESVWICYYSKECVSNFVMLHLDSRVTPVKARTGNIWRFKCFECMTIIHASQVIILQQCCCSYLLVYFSGHPKEILELPISSQWRWKKNFPQTLGAL